MLAPHRPTFTDVMRGAYPEPQGNHIGRHELGQGCFRSPANPGLSRNGTSPPDALTQSGAVCIAPSSRRVLLGASLTGAVAGQLVTLATNSALTSLTSARSSRS